MEDIVLPISIEIIRLVLGQFIDSFGIAAENVS